MKFIWIALVLPFVYFTVISFAVTSMAQDSDSLQNYTFVTKWGIKGTGAGDGKFITKFGSFGNNSGQFEDPEHLAIDSDGNVYVSDRGNNKIQKFSLRTYNQSIT